MGAYQVLQGPEGYLPPAAAMRGVTLAGPGKAMIEGGHVEKQEAIEKIAEKLVSATVPTFFPGPLLLWRTHDYAQEKGRLIREIATETGAKVIPMPDYRPKYPMINPEVEINPNHPNLTIWFNKIDVGVFIGVHCHQANLALKIIRGGTSCYTVALCAEEGHEEANISMRDVDNDTLRAILAAVKALKQKGA